MYDIEDIKKFNFLLRDRRVLKSKVLFSGVNKKTGNSYIQAVAQLKENTKELKELVNMEEAEF